MVYKVDFDELVRRAYESPASNLKTKNELWGNTFALPEWFFIRRGVFPDVRPYTVAEPEIADGKRMVLAFTDIERLYRFVEEEDFLTPNAEALILRQPTQWVLDYLEKLIPQGVYGICFNWETESEGFYCPLDRLRGVKSFLREIGWILP